MVTRVLQSMFGRHAARRLLLLAALVVAWPVAARADGGVVRLNERAGPFVVTVFTAPSPVSVGPVDVSVMVQEATDARPVLDARVSLVLRGEDGSGLAAEATREQAQNQFLYAAPVDLPSPGRWDLQVTVERGPDSVTVATAIPVDPPAPPLLSYWPYLALPPFAIALFAVHQRSRHRRSKGAA